ncbi:MAG: cell wall hydrolase [Firmicutes bacterium]|nr:cell wall hydrolase [Bacillota bacterium]
MNFGYQLQGILLIIFAVITAVLVPFAIYLVFKIARAENEQDRRKAKTRIVHVVVSMILVGLLFGMLTLSGLMDGFTPGRGHGYTLHVAGVGVDSETPVRIRRNNIHELHMFEGYTVEYEFTSGGGYVTTRKDTQGRLILQGVSPGAVTIRVTIWFTGEERERAILSQQFRVFEIGSGGNGGGNFTVDLPPGTVWGGSAADMPPFAVGSGGSTNLHPTTGTVTPWEMAMLSRLVFAERATGSTATRNFAGVGFGWNVRGDVNDYFSDQIAVAEVVVRRWMSSAEFGSSLYSVMSATNQYEPWIGSGASSTITNAGNARWGTESSTQAAWLALNGRTNLSNGNWFQHNLTISNPHNLVWAGAMPFFDNATSAGWTTTRIRDLQTAPMSLMAPIDKTEFQQTGISNPCEINSSFNSVSKFQIFSSRNIRNEFSEEQFEQAEEE